MARPIPGQSYTVENGDTLARIAGRAYGDELKAGLIADANQISSVSAGQEIRIPLLAVVLPRLDQDLGLSLFLDGRLVPVESLSFSSSLDTFLDGWTARLARNPGEDAFLDRVLRPYAYPASSIVLGRSELLRGALYFSGPALAARNEISIEGWSGAADMFDSTARPPYEAEDVNLEDRIRALAEPFQVSVFSALIEDGVFDRVTIDPGEIIGEHVLGLARQRGVLINSDTDGLVLIKLQADSAVVGTIEEGKPGFSGFAGGFDGRKRFSVYRVTAESPDVDIEAVTVRDNAVKRPRFATRQVQDLRRGELDQAARWEKNKALADALSIPITAEGHFAPNGEVWTPGQQVNFISPTLFIDEAFVMLVRRVELIADGSGDRSIVTLVPPSVYGDGELIEPWL